MHAIDLRTEVKLARDAVMEDPSRLQNVIFHLLTVLLEHEADKDLGVASRRRSQER